MAKTLRIELPAALAERLEALVEAGGFADEEEAVRLALRELLGDGGSALQERFQREDVAWALAEKARRRVSPDGFREHDRFVESVQAGLADAEAGRVITDEELGAKLDDLFGPPAAESLKKRLRKDRPMTTIRLSVPEDVLDDLERIATTRGFSGVQPLIRAYVGQGLREDLEARQRSHDPDRESPGKR